MSRIPVQFAPLPQLPPKAPKPEAIEVEDENEEPPSPAVVTTTKAVVVPDALKNMNFGAGMSRPPKAPTQGEQPLTENTAVLETTVRAQGTKGRRPPARLNQRPVVLEADSDEGEDDKDGIDLHANQPILVRPKSYGKGLLVSQTFDQNVMAGVWEKTRISKAATMKKNDPELDVNKKQEIKIEDELAKVLERLVQQRKERIILEEKLEGLKTIVKHVVDSAQLQEAVKLKTKPPKPPSDLELALRHMQEFVNKEGWMEKEGRLWKSWKKRWFVLKCTSIYYYEAEDLKSLKGQLSLDSENISVTRTIHAESSKPVLCVLSNDRKFTFHGSEEELTEWEHSLMRKIDCICYLQEMRKNNLSPCPKVLSFSNDNTSKSFHFDNLFLSNFETICINTTLKYHPSLKSLSLVNTKLNDEALKNLSSSFSLNKNLESLDLSDNLITSIGAKELSDSLLKCSSLKKLVINDNPIGDEGVISLCNLLGNVNSNVSLEILSLHNVNLGDVGGNHFVDSIKKIILNEKKGKKNLLKEISLQENKIGNSTAIGISQIISDLEIKKLNLTKNNIGDEGASSIALALEKSVSIKSFDISENKFSEKGIISLSNAVMKNKSLEFAKLNENQILDASTLTALRIVSDTLSF
eukprot:c19917_g3_i2.p1 GENE.c19917_g3_i2~~c19917_g3_i2.p1  ORF type:complete len:638 (+),score=323.69 c19917_g3_i2:48-1961(+)